MANYSALKATINANIYANGQQLIRGDILQGVLIQMVQTLTDGGFLFKGVATPSTNPGSPDAKVFYICPPGDYSNFGSTAFTIEAGQLGVVTWSNAWSHDSIPVGKNYDADLVELESMISDVSDAIGIEVMEIPVTTTNVTKMLMNSAAKFVTAGSSSYVVAYVSTTKRTKFRVVQDVIGNPAATIGRIGYVDSPSDIVAGNTYTPLWNTGGTGLLDHIVEVPAGKTLVVAHHSSTATAILSVYEMRYDSERLLDIEAAQAEVYEKMQKYPIRGCNLIVASEILDGKRVNNNTGGYTDASSFSAFEVKFCRDQMPIYLRGVYSGYFCIFDKDGNIIDSKGNTGRTLYTGYMLPQGAVRGRFTSQSNRDVSSVYSYIGYYHNLTEEERNNHVAYEDSFSYKPQEVIPTDYQGRDFSTFKRIVCCGDSLTQGVFNTSSGEGTIDTASYCYPRYLADISGREVINLGYGGASTASWWNRFQDDERLTGCDCAIIQLGVNDNMTNWETSSVPAFQNIINRLKSNNNGIKIFLAGIINAKSYPCACNGEDLFSTDQAIRNMYASNWADDPQVFFIDHAKYGHLRDHYSGISLKDNYNMGHLSAYGYNRLAQDYYNYIGWIMHNNNTDFGKIQFTGTTLDY